MTTSYTTSFRAPVASTASPIEPSQGHSRRVPEKRYSFVVWLMLIGLFFPPVRISLPGFNVTPGRSVVLLLLIPAFIVVLGRGRNRVTSDFFAVATLIWILTSSALNDGFRPYAAAEALEFL